MVQLISFMWGMVALFGFIGFVRGWTKELVGLTGIVLAIFALEQFRDVLLAPLAARATPEQLFYLYAVILLIITLASYRVAERMDISTGRGKAGRISLQEGLLGAVVGAFNGYLVVGSLWFYLDSLGYPLRPFINTPALDSASARMVEQLPQVWLLEGDVLTLLVVILFLFVIIVLV